MGVSRVRFLATVAIVGLVGAFAAVPATARAQERTAEHALTPDDTARLLRGETITREQTLERGTARYVGGVTYTLLDATPEEVSDLLDDVASYARVLPKTKTAALVGRNGPDMFVELHQGNAFVDTAYTIRMRRSPTPNEMRFWLDPTKPHGIEDAWGFFRYEPVTDASGATKVLLTYGVLVDLGPGIVRDLFEARVRGALLGVPERVRAYLTSGGARQLAHHTR
jgi:ribosome-associated toxin RatA of RatAB toxin-antitoxin module